MAPTYREQCLRTGVNAQTPPATYLHTHTSKRQHRKAGPQTKMLWLQQQNLPTCSSLEHQQISSKWPSVLWPWCGCSFHGWCLHSGSRDEHGTGRWCGWLILCPCHFQHISLITSYMLLKACKILVRSPSLVLNSGKNSGFSFFWLITNNDVLLPHNMLQTFYYRRKSAMKASIQIKLSALTTYCTIPQF